MSYLDKIKVADETYDIKDSSAAHSVNGQAPDASGNVAVTIPTKTSDLNNDSGFQTATQTTATANAAVATHNTSNTAHADIRETLSGKQAALDTAQMAAVNSGADSTKVGQIATNATDISTINGKIPAAASSSNQLADKSFVNSTVQTASANFRGNWATWSDVPTDANDYPADADGNKTPTKNDYMVVQDASGFPTSPDPALAGTWRFKYSGTWATDGKNGWHPEYQVNETPLTSDQLAALNSGITAEAVSKLGDLANIKSIGANLSLNNTTGELTATDTTYTAGMNVSISSGNVISATDTTYSDFVGTDGTAAGTAGLVPAPATTDAGKVLSADGSWTGLPDGIKTLTTADYNYPTTGTATRVAIWLLPSGIYKAGEAVPVQYTLGTTGTLANGELLIVFNRGGLVRFLRGNSSQYAGIEEWCVDSSGTEQSYVGHSNAQNNLMQQKQIYDGLDSTSAYRPLSANQGKVLNDKIEGRLKTNAGAPTTSTTGTKGQLLEDTTNGNLYICTNSASPYAWKQIDKDEILTNAGAPTTSTAGTLGQLLTDTTNAKLYQLTAIDTTDPQNPSYTWSEIGGSSGPTVVQTTGTSTTDVMSQNAVTSMVYNDPATKSRVQLGKNATADGESSIAIGFGLTAQHAARATGPISLAIGSSSRATAKSAIALGDRASATVQGVMSINSSDSQGYNNSNYRLLTGVYDGQSAHDAATVGQAVGTTESVTIADTDWSALSSSDPYTYSATVTAATTIGANSLVELINDQAVLFATHGFAIGAISGQSVTIYSVGQPSASVSLKINVKG